MSGLGEAGAGGTARAGQGGWLGRGAGNGPVPAVAQTYGAWGCARVWEAQSL